MDFLSFHPSDPFPQLGGGSEGSLKTVSPFTRCCTAMGIPILVPQRTGWMFWSWSQEPIHQSSGKSEDPLGTCRVSRRTQRATSLKVSEASKGPSKDSPLSCITVTCPESCTKGDSSHVPEMQSSTAPRTGLTICVRPTPSTLSNKKSSHSP